jgi:hypothetical protein
MRLNIMLTILLEFRINIQIKIQNKKIIIDQHVNDHFSNVLHCRFESLSVIRSDLIIDENDDSELSQSNNTKT